MSVSNERPEFSLEREVVHWCDSVYAEAEDDLTSSHDFKLVTKIIDYIEGRQWSAKSRFGRSRPVKNRLFRQFIETVGLLTDIQPDFQVKIRDRIDGFSELEKLLNMMIVDWAEMTDFEMELSQVVMYGLIHTGYAKVIWNSDLFGGLGDVEFQPISPVNLMVVGSSSKLQEAECIIARRVVNMAWVKRKYGDIANGVRPDSQYSELPGMTFRPSRISKGSWARLGGPLKTLLGTKTEGTQSKYPQVMLKDFWFKDDEIWHGSESILVGRKNTNWSYMVEPGMPLWPRGRVVTIAGGKVLEDTCNPYWDAKFPFVAYRPYKVPWKFHGLSMMEPQVALQNIINRINGGVMDTINAAIEPSIMGPRAAMSQGNWDALDPGAPGAKIVYNNNTPRPPEFRKPPELGSYVLPFEQSIEAEMDLTSGAAAMNQLMQKKQVPGGDSIEKINSSRSTNIRFAGRSLQSFLTEGGTMVISRNLQFSDTRHRIARFGSAGVTGNDFEPIYGSTIPQGMKPEQFVSKVQFTVKKGSLLAIEREEELPIAFALRKQGDMSRRGLYRVIDKNVDVGLIEKELKEEAAEKVALGGAAAALAHKGKGGH